MGRHIYTLPRLKIPPVPATGEARKGRVDRAASSLNCGCSAKSDPVARDCAATFDSLECLDVAKGLGEACITLRLSGFSRKNSIDSNATAFDDLKRTRVLQRIG